MTIISICDIVYTIKQKEKKMIKAKYCRNCGVELKEGQDICTSCGFSVGRGNKYCPNCGKEVSSEQDMCVNCGCRLKGGNGNSGESLGGQSKTTMAIICFFLGGLGIHNFIMGETKKGVFKIIMSFCFGIGGILAIIDFVKILIDKYEVNKEKLI